MIESFTHAQDLTTSDVVWHTSGVEAPIRAFRALRDPQDLATPEVGTVSLPGGAMPTTVGRPSKHEQRQRTARFLALAAAGMRLDLAARQAGVKPERALRLVSDRDAFEEALQAMGTAA